MTARDEWERLVAEALAEHLPDSYGDHGCALRCGWSDEGTTDSAAEHLAAAILSALAPHLPEETVREEWGVRDFGDDIIFDPDWRGRDDILRSMHGHGYRIAPGTLVRRTITTYAPKVGPWEVVEP